MLQDNIHFSRFMWGESPSYQIKSFYFGSRFRMTIKISLPRYPEDPQYPYGEKGEDDHVQVIGKMLGTVSATSLLTP